MAWLPKSYKAPSMGGDFLNPSRIPESDHMDRPVKIRVLGNFDFPKTAIMGWSSWERTAQKNICHRVEYSDEAKGELEARGYDDVKHFWALLVYNWEEMRPQAFEFTQASIRNDLLKLFADPDWEDPKDYDIKIRKNGSGVNTKYSVVPVGKAELPKDVRDQIKASKYDLTRLFKNEQVFEGSVTPLEKPKAVKETKQIPTQEEEDVLF